MYDWSGKLTSEELKLTGKDALELVQGLSSITSFKILQLLSKESLDVSSIARKMKLSEAHISGEINRLQDLKLINVSYAPGKRGIRKVCETAIKKVVEGNPSEEKVDDIDVLIERKLEQREKQRAEVQAKEEEVQKIVEFFKTHPDTTENDEKLGNDILDYIEREKLPYNLNTVKLVYDSMTKDIKTKEAVDKELNTKKIKDLERESATSVGKDGSGGGVKPKTKSSLSDLIGGFTDPNAL